MRLFHKVPLKRTRPDSGSPPSGVELAHQLNRLTVALGIEQSSRKRAPRNHQGRSTHNPAWPCDLTAATG